MTYYKDKVIKLQQMLDEKDTEIKRLTNELFLCQESQLERAKTSEDNASATPYPKFEARTLTSLIKGSKAAMKRFNRKKDTEEK